MSSDPRVEELERSRGQAAPEVRRFVDWAALEFTDKLTADFRTLGLPPMLATTEARNMARILVRRVLGVAKTYHRMQS